MVLRFSHLHEGTFTFTLDKDAEFYTGRNAPGKKEIELELTEELPIFVDLPKLGIRITFKPNGFTVGNIPGTAIGCNELRGAERKKGR